MFRVAIDADGRPRKLTYGSGKAETRESDTGASKERKQEPSVGHAAFGVAPLCFLREPRYRPHSETPATEATPRHAGGLYEARLFLRADLVLRTVAALGVAAYQRFKSLPVPEPAEVAVLVMDPVNQVLPLADSTSSWEQVRSRFESVQAIPDVLGVASRLNYS